MLREEFCRRENEIESLELWGELIYKGYLPPLETQCEGHCYIGTG
jgi:hypothetical protein